MAKKYVNFRVGGSPYKVTDDYSVWTNDLTRGMNTFAGASATDNDVVGSDNSDEKHLDQTSEALGRGLALDGDGDRMAVVAQRDDGLNDGYGNTGAVYLFTFDENTFFILFTFEISMMSFYPKV